MYEPIFGFPAVRLMAEVGAGLEELAHGEIGQCHGLVFLRLDRREGCVLRSPIGNRTGNGLEAARDPHVWDGRAYGRKGPGWQARRHGNRQPPGAAQAEVRNPGFA